MLFHAFLSLPISLTHTHLTRPPTQSVKCQHARVCFIEQGFFLPALSVTQLCVLNASLCTLTSFYSFTDLMLSLSSSECLKFNVLFFVTFPFKIIDRRKDFKR